MFLGHKLYLGILKFQILKLFKLMQTVRNVGSASREQAVQAQPSHVFNVEVNREMMHRIQTLTFNIKK